MTRPSLSLSVQYPDNRLKNTLPRWRLRRWVQAALQIPAVITLRFVDTEEGKALNSTYRGKDYATNVLTFPYDSPSDFIPLPDTSETPADKAGTIACADIILCTDVLTREAEQQRKTVTEHAAHLVIHGVLHAQGYDHIQDDEAVEMETLETAILAKLGFDDPYKVID